MRTLVPALENLAKKSPLFAHAQTLSSHHPYQFVPGHEVDSSALGLSQKAKEYQAYLSTLHYTDSALNHFFEELMKSEIQDNTLVVLLSDHSTGFIEPRPPDGPVQTNELLSRIPLAFVTKNMPHPTRVARPVHQIDIAPTVAAIAGVPEIRSWLGRNIFAHPSGPILVTSPNEIYSRCGDTICIAHRRQNVSHCSNLPSKEDPLFLPSPLTLHPAQNQNELSYYRKVIDASQALADLSQ